MPRLDGVEPADEAAVASAAALEREGDMLAARGQPCARQYRDAQALLMPPGASFDDRIRHDRRMAAFTRLQDKLYALAPDGRPRSAVAPSAGVAVRQAATITEKPAPPWRAPALAGRLDEAVSPLRGEVNGRGGMGFHAAEGYRLEALGDALAASDPAAARAPYEAALKSYLCYVLMPARGDSEQDGYIFAEIVLAKLLALDDPKRRPDE